MITTPDEETQALLALLGFTKSKVVSTLWTNANGHENVHFNPHSLRYMTKHTKRTFTSNEKLLKYLASSERKREYE